MYFIMYYHLFFNFISMLFYCFYVCTPLPFSTTSPGHSSLAIRLGLNAATSFSSLTLEVDYRGSKDVVLPYHNTDSFFSYVAFCSPKYNYIYLSLSFLVSFMLSSFLFTSLFHPFSLSLYFFLSCFTISPISFPRFHLQFSHFHYLNFSLENA